MTAVSVMRCDACLSEVSSRDAAALKKWVQVVVEGATVADLCEDCVKNAELISAESAERLGRAIAAAIGELPA